jgi:glycosyltransferase involved in cell wall biosynthesis
MKILFLIPYPLKAAPSQRFRFEQYLNLLTENGFEITNQSFWDEPTWTILYKSANSSQKAIGFLKGLVKRFIVLIQVSKFDFVFVHRECLPIGPPIIEWLIAKVFKKKIIYDFDDAIWLPNTSQENKLVAFAKWHGKVAHICKWSYKVSCGNSFLANYALQFNQKVIVNPTTVDTANLHNPSRYTVLEKSPPVVIGWTGTQSTLAYLDSIAPILQKLEAKFTGQVRLLIIANKAPQLNLKFVDFIPWSKQTEVEDLLKMDIGIMPLNDDIWAKGKCGFKALQYMALEIPAVVSPVGVNTKIIDNGTNGYWCATEIEWLNCLEKLISDTVLRKQIGVAGRKKIVSHYSILSNSSNFLGLFS